MNSHKNMLTSNKSSCYNVFSKLLNVSVMLSDNPVCEDAPGCGEWKPPQIKNPKYKGKWRPPQIENPNYKASFD